VIIPWGTDAPIYHRPIATIGVMVACVVAFAVDPRHEHTEYLLALGDGVHPLQWLTNIFLHGDIMHLLGNLLFLWAFGIIVEGEVEVSVTDTGIGIREKDLPHVLNRSYQADDSDRAVARGLSGLGLAIVRRIVEAHNSKIQIESIEGQGTTFRFVMPLSVG